jgi:diadenosine tetraphosphate (Ap4A) HIT family hydrolase
MTMALQAVLRLDEDELAEIFHEARAAAQKLKDEVSA